MPVKAKHTLVVYCEDRPGVLNRITSLFRRRGFNLESVTVGRTDQPDIARLTITVDGANTVLEQVEKQLNKLIDVLKVSEIPEEMGLMRELALIKVSTNAGTLPEVKQLADIYKGRIIDISPDSAVVEITGPETKIDSFIQLMRRFGVKEIARSGRVAMSRGSTVIKYSENGREPD